MKTQAVYVKWSDAHHGDEATTEEILRECVLEEVGWLVGATETHVSVALEKQPGVPDQWRKYITIPRVNIVEIRKVSIGTKVNL